MILLDYSQTSVSNIMQNLTSPESSGLEPDLVKHMILNSIRSYITKYGPTYGNLVICCDGRNYWRKDIFPYYKKNRSDMRKDSQFDWNEIYRLVNETKTILKEHFPYKLIDVPCAEADDVIAVLTKQNHDKEKVLIISGDKDFAQLQKYPTVKQYAPVQKKDIKITNPKEFLIEHIIRGDKGDGIPNFLSPDDSFVNGIRQKPIMTKSLEQWVKMSKDEVCTTEEMKSNWERNQALVDFEYIPQDVANSILQEYNSIDTSTLGKKSIYDYMVAAKMRQLVYYVDDFLIGQDGKKQGLEEFFN